MTTDWYSIAAAQSGATTHRLLLPLGRHNVLMLLVLRHSKYLPSRALGVLAAAVCRRELIIAGNRLVIPAAFMLSSL